MTVIGPIDRDIWITMRMLRSSIAYSKACNDNNLDLSDAIERETKLYRDYKSDIMKHVAA